MEKGNFKVRCINTISGYGTKGKFYQFREGRTKWDAGMSSAKYDGFEDFADSNPGFSQNFELVNDKPQYIIITQQNQTVTATLKQGKEVVKTAEAKCSPTDTFEFGIGAKLAVERLFGLEIKEEVKKEKFKVGDMVVLKQDISGIDTWSIEEKSIQDFRKTSHVISEINNKPYNGKQVLNFDDFGFSWNEDLFELATKPAIKEVKRPARVGERVKIVKSECSQYSSCQYQNGDILEIIDMNGTLPKYGAKDFDWLYYSEYVVLENYNPSTNTPTESTPPQINYSEIDYTKLSTKKMLKEIERMVRENG